MEHFAFFVYFSVWNECGWSSMDRAKGSCSKRWFPQCHGALPCDVASGVAMLHFPCPLFPIDCLASEEVFEKNLVT